MWTLIVEATGKIVRDRQTVGFFFHLVGLILFVKYCCRYSKQNSSQKYDFILGMGSVG
ncbi:hypothetical protein BACOVA_05318 [Bacteroides ovatus ATCC 8483]|uniref:Uncharacterized protein n=1 Tax=Bacteroides ovatus (strain ATCC 8483 / DSM 1896 / JCM 5824 / BCRC 10623 / CCUG 4943 / NCTC 11153) TaxID=411476 RepID=A0AAN3D522_BACO1|nr:hypothetical protein BACOVA_05318 [Bacteroides ovatus ATCC 8483]